MLVKLVKVAQSEKSSKRVIQATSNGVEYDGKFLFQNFSTEIRKIDKIAIIGQNGCGKTTLQIAYLVSNANTGEVVLADNIKIAYFDQLRDQLDESLSIIDNVKEGSDFINIAGKEVHVIAYLQKFLFYQRASHSFNHSPIRW